MGNDTAGWLERARHPNMVREPIATMKTAALLLSLVSAVAAAPAIVWRTGSASPVHTSEEVSASQVLQEGLSVSDQLQVVFLLHRSADGNEALSSLAGAGALPRISEKYSQAEAVHHHVTGVDSPSAMVDYVSDVSPTFQVLDVSLPEFTNKFQSLQDTTELEIDATGTLSKSAKVSNKRTRALAGANVLVVRVDATTDASLLDAAVADAIESQNVHSVVLSAVRSHAEVKQERDRLARHRFLLQQQAGQRMTQSRRLEQQDGGDGGNDQDMSGVYYVLMTPNILAGILFFMMFAVTTWIGISCMGMISGQTVYVDKMPAIGREA